MVRRSDLVNADSDEEHITLGSTRSESGEAAICGKANHSVAAGKSTQAQCTRDLDPDLESDSCKVQSQSFQASHGCYLGMRCRVLVVVMLCTCMCVFAMRNTATGHGTTSTTPLAPFPAVSSANASLRSPMWKPVPNASTTPEKNNASHEAPRKDVCTEYKSKHLFAQADADFSMYAKVNSTILEKQYAKLRKACASRDCLHVIILRGRVIARLGQKGSYQSRWKSIAFQIFITSQRFYPLPDAEFFVDTDDGFCVGYDSDDPLFRAARLQSQFISEVRRGRGSGILYPDFTFFEWPESRCTGEVSHSHAHLLERFAELFRKTKTDSDWWAKKNDTMFWRGAELGDRKSTIRQSKLRKQRGVDIKFMSWADKGTCVTLLDHCKYKYIPYIRGNSYSSRFKYNLLCGSCVFTAAVEVGWEEWWTRLFTPGKDYVEVGVDWRNASAVLSEVRSSSDGGRTIAESGQRKALDLLSENAVYCYWNYLICQASSILPHHPWHSAPAPFNKFPKHFYPIEDILFCSMPNGC